MSWHKLTSQQQDLLVKDNLSDFISRPEEYPTAKDCWRDFISDNHETITKAILSSSVIKFERLYDLALKDDRFYSACRDYLETTINDD